MRKWIVLLITSLLLIGQAYSSQSGNCYNYAKKTVCSGQRGMLVVCSIYPLRIEICTMRSNGYSVNNCYGGFANGYWGRSYPLLLLCRAWAFALGPCCGGAVTGQWVFSTYLKQLCRYWGCPGTDDSYE